jgi:hypothetical protein
MMADEKKIALKIVTGGQEKEVTFDELTLANNLSQEALVRVLVKKNIVTPQELLEELQRVRQERYSGSQSPPEK